jgi:hypothetical protein
MEGVNSTMMYWKTFANVTIPPAQKYNINKIIRKKKKPQWHSGTATSSRYFLTEGVGTMNYCLDSDMFLLDCLLYRE